MKVIFHQTGSSPADKRERTIEVGHCAFWGMMQREFILTGVQSQNYRRSIPFLAFLLPPSRNHLSTPLLKDRSSLTQAVFLKLTPLKKSGSQELGAGAGSKTQDATQHGTRQKPPQHKPEEVPTCFVSLVSQPAFW
jgi:hypothetical protein